MPGTAFALAWKPDVTRFRGTRSMSTTAPVRTVRRDTLTRWVESGHPLVYPEGNESKSYRALKRGLDILGALTAIVLFAPLMLIAGLAPHHTGEIPTVWHAWRLRREARR